MKSDKETIIITIYVIIDTLCKNFLKTPAQKQKLTDGEVITIALCSAIFFNSNHDKALVWLRIAGYFPAMLSLSRFNRRIHHLKEFIEFCCESVREILARGDLYIEDSMPLPVCKRVRACRNKKVQGQEYCGYCAAKKEKFFGFRLHLIVDTEGIPVSFAVIPGAYHDLTCVYEISASLPENSKVIGDKAFNCKADEKALKELGTTLMPIRRKNMKKQWSVFEERFIIREHREQIETSFSILSDVMGLNGLKATTRSGFLLKAYTAVLDLIFYIMV
jgi:hypothetical protein